MKKVESLALNLSHARQVAHDRLDEIQKAKRLLIEWQSYCEALPRTDYLQDLMGRTTDWVVAPPAPGGSRQNWPEEAEENHL